MLRASFCTLAVLAFFAVGLTSADDSKNKSDKDKNHDKATITKVDSKASTVTVTMKGKDGKKVEKTFPLAEGAEYFDSHGKAAKIDAFHSGDHVLITEKDGKITELKKAKEHAQATITKVDAKKGTVTAKMKDGEGKQVEKTFYLTEDVEYVDSTGNVATIDVFQSGDEVLIVETEGKIKELKKDSGHVAKAENLDAHFAACLIIGNQNEIASGKLAEQRSKSPEVKKFAQMMEKDHQQFIDDLEKFAGQQFRNGQAAKEPAAEARRDSRTENARKDRSSSKDAERTKGERQNEGPATAAGERTPARNGAEKDFSRTSGAPADIHLQIQQEIADECLASTQRELSSKEGREFDACYIGMQLAAHMFLIDELKVLERHASTDLQSVLRKGRETAQEHLVKAKEIMKDIEKGKPRETTSK